MSEKPVAYLGEASILPSLLAANDGDGRIQPGHVVATMYGNTLLFRGYCSDCRMNAFIEHGRVICCGDEYMVKKIVQARGAIALDRRYNSPDERDRLVAAQGGLCFYCMRPFWGEIYRKAAHAHQKSVRASGVIVLRPTTDHFVPFAYCQSNGGANKVAACHICNSIKRAIIFVDVEAARDYLAMRWRQKGYRDGPYDS